jgi:hypothetical protein
MDGIIEILRNASSTEQAIGVSVGGLIGVFATLAFFFVLIAAADHFSKH